MLNVIFAETHKKHLEPSESGCLQNDRRRVFWILKGVHCLPEDFLTMCFVQIYPHPVFHRQFPGITFNSGLTATTTWNSSEAKFKTTVISDCPKKRCRFFWSWNEDDAFAKRSVESASSKFFRRKNTTRSRISTKTPPCLFWPHSWLHPEYFGKVVVTKLRLTRLLSKVQRSGEDCNRDYWKMAYRERRNQK